MVEALREMINPDVVLNIATSEKKNENELIIKESALDSKIIPIDPYSNIYSLDVSIKTLRSHKFALQINILHTIGTITCRM